MPYKFNIFTGTLDIVSASGSGPTGNVTGLPPTDINAIARWADTSADSIKNSPGTFIEDSGAIQSQAFAFNRQILNDVTVPNHFSVISTDIELVSGDLILLGDSQLLLL